MKEKILVVGGGGREQAIAHKLSSSPDVGRVYLSPGNPGSEYMSARYNRLISNVEPKSSTAGGVVDLTKSLDVDLVVVGPEAWLEQELGDILINENISAIAPQKDRAILELDKVYTRVNAQRWGVPQPHFAHFSDPGEACQYVKYLGLNEGVIKVSGPALGKGVTVCDTRGELYEAISSAKANFGSAAEKILVEQRLYGIEVSYIVITDGVSFVPLTPAMDYKRLKDDDEGPNTGGMGSIAPNPYLNSDLTLEIESTIIKPIIDGMRNDGIPYVGILYAGVMLTETGPKLIEINCRMGDPETQVQLPLLSADLYKLFKKTLSGELGDINIQPANNAAATVVLAAENYPSAPHKGDVIRGLDADFPSEVIVYQAGTTRKNGHVVSNGGRVLSVTGVGESVEVAAANAYAQIGKGKIIFEQMQYRKDIGKPKK